MWCSNCQQDMPSVAHPTNGRMVCTRCQRTMRTSKPHSTPSISDDGIPLDEPVAAVAAATPPRIDEWSRSTELRELSRKLRRAGGTPAVAAQGVPILQGPRRFDPPQFGPEVLQHASFPLVEPLDSQPLASSIARRNRTDASQVVAWFVVFVGTMVLGGGIGLVAQSLSTQQMVYWNLALGLTLGGQGTLILGLVLVVSRLWRSSRHVAGKLHDAVARLGQLQQTADALSAMRSGGAPAFYADLARGASPQMLLANLKGQLDQLAARLGRG